MQVSLLCFSTGIRCYKQQGPGQKSESIVKSGLLPGGTKSSIILDTGSPYSKYYTPNIPYSCHRTEPNIPHSFILHPTFLIPRYCTQHPSFKNTAPNIPRSQMLHPTFLIRRYCTDISHSKRLNPTSLIYRYCAQHPLFSLIHEWITYTPSFI